MLHGKPYNGPTKVVIAFDIGTTHSAVSYCILEQGQIPKIHSVHRFPGQEHGRGDGRVPSVLYYDNVGNVREIGSAALTDENVFERAKDGGWMVKWWKLHLHPKHLAYTHIKRDDIPPLPPGKSVEDILTDFIRYLFHCSRTYIEDNHIGFNWQSVKDTTEFVLAHPNGWEVEQQQHYRRAVERAGLVPATCAGRSRVHLIPEGEASLRYCVSRLPEQPDSSEPQGVVIIDAGGGIIDLNMYSMSSDPLFCEEIALAQSLLQGSILVTCRAATLLQGKLRGSPHSTPDSIADLAREFDEETKLTINSADKVARIMIGDIRYNNARYSIRSGFLKLSGEDATGLFEDSIQAILGAFEKQLQLAMTKITMAFLVGGFTNNQWFWTRLRSYFKARGIEVCLADDDVDKAAAYGAVLSRVYCGQPVLLRFSHETYTAKRALLQKPSDGTQEDAIAKIMGLTGLRQVKGQVMHIKGIIDMMNRQGVPINKERLNLVLLGNPGTGKTTVARLYAQFLQNIKALPGNAFIETTGSKLAFEGVQGAQKLIDDALKVGGGTIFIDEAYQLASQFNPIGKQVLDFILAEMENRVGTIVFILAGYNKEMEKFFEHNPGFPSRVPHQLQFSDYTDQELMSMLEDLIYIRYNGRMKVDDTINGLYTRIAIKRLGRGRGTPGFGNARALQNMFSKVRQRQAERLQRERTSGVPADDFFLTKEDLIGPDPSKVLAHSAPWKKLQGLIGLESVKNSVCSLFSLLETNYHRELAEKEPMQMSLNRVFLGSPGTGKTTVAKLYGQILVDLGMLSNGEVVVKNPADFIGAHLGHSEQNTKAILESTRGKVLVIDEAYMLYNKNPADSYKTAVIDTMVAEIQSIPGEDRCVLLLGYKDQMEEMFQNVNPGLSRRFSIEDAFIFEDFTEPELMQILEYKLKDQDLSATDEAKKVALELLSRMKHRPNFGNAGEVENLLGQAKARYQRRMASVPASRRMEVVFEPQDFDPNFDRSQNASQNLAQTFADIVGCDEVIKKLGDYQRIAKLMKEKGRDMRALIPTNFVFKGPPGTGKTTIARKLGQVYYDMGFLASKEVIECSASDLVGQFVGHTGPKTKGVFEKALGKVLFIDEAYRLGDGLFAKEAMDEIVGLMTHERFMNKMVIVLAGYEDQMNSLLRVNPGLSSRFSEEIVFQNMTPKQCLELLDKVLKKQEIVVPELADETSLAYLEMQNVIIQISSLPWWGNGRDIKTLGKRMTQKAFANLATDETSALTAREALVVMDTMLHEHLARQGATRTPPPWGNTPMAMMNGFSPPPPSMSSTSTSQAPRRPSASPEHPPSSDQPQVPRRELLHSEESTRDQPPTSRHPRRDAGVSDAIWHQLQADIKTQEEARRKAAEEERRLEQELKEAEKQQQAEQRRAADLERKAMENANRQRASLDQKREIERMLKDVHRRAAERKARVEKAAAALKKKRQAQAEKKRKELEMQQKIRDMGLCPQGYQFVKQGDGYRCRGGSHFVSHSDLA